MFFELIYNYINLINIITRNTERRGRTHGTCNKLRKFKPNSISLNEEIQICNDGNVDIRECEREIDEFYDKIILKRDNRESMGIAKDNLVNTNINTSCRSGSG